MILIRCDCCLKEEWIETIGSPPDMEHFTDPMNSAVYYPSLRWPKGWILARAPGNFFGESGTPTACSTKCARDLARGVVQKIGDGMSKIEQPPPRLLTGVSMGASIEDAPPKLLGGQPVFDAEIISKE